MKRIGVFTSGGDAPGMNACIRAVVRTALFHGVEAIGIMRGYQGMIEGDFVPMDRGTVSNIIQTGGTILKTSRCKEFYYKSGRQKAIQKLREAGIDGLIAVGGDGTFKGAHKLCIESGIPVIGVPATIDNDLYGTDYTIGFDTAINTALDAIDRIRDTAIAHGRIFWVEVMGRVSGFIAVDVGVAGGAEAILIPEVKTDVDELSRQLLKWHSMGKTSCIMVVAEGDEAGGAFQLAQFIKDRTKLDSRVTVLGHIQRGGKPTARDRVLASKLGAAAVEALLAGESDKMVGEINGQIVLTPLKETYSKKKRLDRSLIALAQILAT
ncbi:MAG: 6-phosphofructokinase [Armatimonadota bacterium]|nr:6-phosphofructokinase [Armatimonadota bacterium]MCX7776573.1 6-phosphofructokinase [Armatimonadota bacterium]MDW8026093.1 6-phosphofructokinase [Armatimonadota bacterium]